MDFFSLVIIWVLEFGFWNLGFDMIKLGVNIDHVATLRQARLGKEPDVLHAAWEAEKGGADGITVHLREDRRHIQDTDVTMLRKRIHVPLNLEMSLAPEIVEIALRVLPEKVCLVPEKRRELTTEGGLAVNRELNRVKQVVEKLAKKGVIVSLFIGPEEKDIWAAKKAGAHFVEFHTGEYANARSALLQKKQLAHLKDACLLAYSLGLGVNAGHGLNYQNVEAICKLPHLEELNIGHSIVSRAVFVGLQEAVREMKKAISPTGAARSRAVPAGWRGHS